MPETVWLVGVVDGFGDRLGDSEDAGVELGVGNGVGDEVFVGVSVCTI